MFCPQCGLESQSTQYCRSCGANLKVIGKAVALSEAIARSDRGPLPKIREMVKGLKLEHVPDEVAGAFERMTNELATIPPESKPRKSHRPWIEFRKKKTPEERREQHITKGVVSMFSGVGLTIFLYFVSAALVLKLPPNVVNQIPVEIEPLLRVIWLFGLIPTLSGVGHIISGLLISTRQAGTLNPAQVDFPRHEVETGPTTPTLQGSVTDHTTELLDRESFGQRTSRI
jgi:hypothetical protein